MNGIKFHRQGKQPKQDMLDRFRKITRSSDGHLKCKGQTKAKLHQEHHQHNPQMQNDAVFIGMEHRNLDLISTIFQTKYPRYNGRDAPLPYDELVKVDDLTNLEPENEYEFALINNDVEVREEGEDYEDEEEFLEVNFPNPEYIQPLIVDGKSIFREVSNGKTFIFSNLCVGCFLTRATNIYSVAGLPVDRS